jgi:hypothetical protein
VVRGIVKLLQEKYAVKRRDEQKAPAEEISTGAYEQPALEFDKGGV